jgi:hypothetical protein
LLALLERHADVFAQHVLARLAPEDRASLARVANVCRDAVYPMSVFPDGLLLATTRRRSPGDEARVLKLRYFFESVERLAWDKANGCPWTAATCMHLAWHAPLEVFTWARLEHDCPWDRRTCEHAVGRLEVLKWAREHGCPWDARTACSLAAVGGHLETLIWLRANDCPWDEGTTYLAADQGHMDVLRWAREHGCPWIAEMRNEAATMGYSDNLPLSV